MRQGLVHLDDGRLIEWALLDVSDNPHDGDRGHVSIEARADLYVQADGIASMEILLSEGLADDGHQGGSIPFVGGIEVAPANERNMQRRKIVALHEVVGSDEHAFAG